MDPKRDMAPQASADSPVNPVSGGPNPPTPGAPSSTGSSAPVAAPGRNDTPLAAPDKNAVPANLPGQQVAPPALAPKAGPSPASAAPAELKKYIRTFATDMEIVKQGGTPDLAPYVKHADAAAAHAAPTPQAPARQESAPPPPAPAFRPAPLPERPQPREELNILVRPPEKPPGIVFPAPTPAPLPEEPPPALVPPPAPVFRPAPVPPPPAPAPKPPPAPPPKPSPLQTYSSDFSTRVKETGASRATVLAAEQDARRGPVRAAPKKKGNAAAVLGGMLLIVLGGAGAYYAYAQYARTMAPVSTDPVVTAPIFVNETRTVTGTGPTLVRAFTESLARPPSSGAVRELSLATTTTNVFFALQLSAPDVLLRNVAVAPSVGGVVNAGTPSVFFILPALSYSDTFAGMLLWEPTMLRDLGTLFPAISVGAPATTTAPTGSPRAASTTPRVATASAPPLGVPGFVDEVVQNHDVRVYRDERGNARILYGYWNQRTLVIARDPEAFTELVNRLRNSRTR